MYRSCRMAGDMGLRHAMLTVVISWLLMSLVGLLPFVLVSYWTVIGDELDRLRVFRNFWNALVRGAA